MADVAVTTGAAGGIGRPTAKRFLSAGWDIAMVDIGDALEALSQRPVSLCKA